MNAGDTVTGADFAAWLVNGFSMSAVDWAILSAPTGGTTYASGSGAAVTQTFLFADSNPGGRSYGFDVDNESFSIPSWVAPTTGTYWLELSNGVTNGNTPLSDAAYWDENDNASISAWSSFAGGEYLTSGVEGCSSPSCTQTFDITGDPVSAVPEPGSFALAGLGILGLAIVYRRRLAAR